jgi:hypothetical protein
MEGETWKDEMVKKGIRPCASIGCRKPAIAHVALEQTQTQKHSVVGICEEHLLAFLEEFVVEVKTKNAMLHIPNLKIDETPTSSSPTLKGGVSNEAS